MNETTISKSTAKAADKAAMPEGKEYGIVIGTLVGFADGTTPLVAYNGHQAMAARTLVEVDEEHIGKSVALQFERGDLRSPLVTGIVKMGISKQVDDEELPKAAIGALPVQAKLDDEEIVLVAQKRITLQCGRASISLDADGNVEIRGKYILSRASGQNRIKGSSISLN